MSNHMQSKKKWSCCLCEVRSYNLASRMKWSKELQQTRTVIFILYVCYGGERELLVCNYFRVESNFL